MEIFRHYFPFFPILVLDFMNRIVLTNLGINKFCVDSAKNNVMHFLLREEQLGYLDEVFNHTNFDALLSEFNEAGLTPILNFFEKSNTSEKWHQMLTWLMTRGKFIPLGHPSWALSKKNTWNCKTHGNDIWQAWLTLHVEFDCNAQAKSTGSTILHYLMQRPEFLHDFAKPLIESTWKI